MALEWIRAGKIAYHKNVIEDIFIVGDDDGYNIQMGTSDRDCSIVLAKINNYNTATKLLDMIIHCKDTVADISTMIEMIIGGKNGRV